MSGPNKLRWEFIKERFRQKRKKTRFRPRKKKDQEKRKISTKIKASFKILLFYSLI